MWCQLASAAALLGNLLLARKSWDQALCCNDSYWPAIEGLSTVLFALEDFYGRSMNITLHGSDNSVCSAFSLPSCYIKRFKTRTKLPKRYVKFRSENVLCLYYSHTHVYYNCCFIQHKCLYNRFSLL